MVEGGEFCCERAGDLAVDFLEGQLSEAHKARIEEHMRDCPPCVRFLETYRKTTKLCRKGLLSEVPVEFTGRLKSFLRENCSKTKAEP